MTTAHTYQQHILDLAQAFGVRVVMDTKLRSEPTHPRESPRADPDERLVHTAFVIDERSYAAALHELGHVLSPTGSLWQHMDGHGAWPSLRNVALLLEQEDAAWAWARQYALVWTDAMTALQDWARGTYAEGAARWRRMLGEEEAA